MRNSNGKITWKSKFIIDLDYATDLSVLGENVSIPNEYLEVLSVQSVRIGLEIEVKKTNKTTLEISEDEQMMLGN